MDILAYILGKNAGSGSADDVSALEKEVGTLSDLTTDNKDDLVSAINEVAEEVDTKTVTLTESNSDSYAKVYTISQGDTTLGVINIPKDMVVSSGEVTTIDGETFIVLTLANASGDKIYINVADLVDTYTAETGASQIQITIDASTRVISAVIVDGAVTKAKLASSVQASLDNADSAVQSVETGSSNGTIAVDGTDVAVKGLGSAAYTNSTDYATAAQGTKADSAVQSVETGSANGTISVDGTDVSVKGLGSAAYTDSTAYDAAGAANTVKTSLIGTSADSASSSTIYGAKAYADDAVDKIYWALEDDDTLTMYTS